MPLLNKFVTFPSKPAPVERHVVGGQAHLADIVGNLKVLLQSRRTLDITQNIGLSDFNDLSIDESLMHRLCSDIQSQICLHESRLTDVEVELAENGTARWLLAVNAKLIESEPLNEKLGTNKSVSFTLDISKPAYRAAKRDINGVFL